MFQPPVVVPVVPATVVAGVPAAAGPLVVLAAVTPVVVPVAAGPLVVLAAVIAASVVVPFSCAAPFSGSFAVHRYAAHYHARTFVQISVRSR